MLRSHWFAVGLLAALLPWCAAVSRAGEPVYGDLTTSNAIYLFNYLFLEGPEPVSPFPDCGFPEEVGLPCEVQDSCDP